MAPDGRTRRRDGAAFVHVAAVCKPRCKDHVEVEGLHCMPVVLSRRVSDAFLYARFVYTVISLVKRDPAFEVFPLPEGVRPSRREGQLHHDFCVHVVD